MFRRRDQKASPREANMHSALLVAVRMRDYVMPRSLTRNVAKRLVADRCWRQKASLEGRPKHQERAMHRQSTNNLQTVKHVSCASIWTSVQSADCICMQG